MWARPNGTNEVGQTHRETVRVDRMPLNALSTSEVVGGTPMMMGNDGGDKGGRQGWETGPQTH